MPRPTAYDYVRRVKRWWNRRRELRRANDYRRQHVGEGSLIDETVHVLGWQQVRIGHHTIIAEGTWINVNQRDQADPAVTIGDNCFIGRRNFLTAGVSITIGDYCLTGPDCHFLGADHDSSSPFTPFSISGVPANGVIEVGANCWFGSSVIVLKNVRIGFGSILGAGALVTRDCPPFSMMVGSPARIIKRFDLRRKAWVKAEEYPADGDSLLPTEAEYLADLRSRHPAIKGARAASGKAFGDF
ncbi:MAG: acyltransferase [Chthoniobacter sp.]|uniref:acyltransferase n=1 Tax=Chthoniobacter sp. TaxID=2510640 RepID=UPI0032A85BA6